MLSPDEEELAEMFNEVIDKQDEIRKLCDEVEFDLKLILEWLGRMKK